MVFGKRGRGKPKKPYLEDINHRIQIAEYSGMKGAAYDRREWWRLAAITFRV